VRPHPPSSESGRTRWGSPPRRRVVSRELAQHMREILESPASRSRGIYDLNAMSKDLKLHMEGRIDASGPLFRVAQFEHGASFSTTISI